MDTLILYFFVLIIKIYNFRGDLSDISANTATLQVTALREEAETMALDLKKGMYIDNESDVLDVVEDLQERVAHMAEMKAACERFKLYQEELGLPEVRTLPILSQFQKRTPNRYCQTLPENKSKNEFSQIIKVKKTT